MAAKRCGSKLSDREERQERCQLNELHLMALTLGRVPLSSIMLIIACKIASLYVLCSIPCA